MSHIAIFNSSLRPQSWHTMWVATLAQLVEHPPCKRTVVGSSPTGGSIFLSGKPTPVFLCFQAFCLAGLARAMRNDKLPPNMWAGIRTKAASESEASWYQVQRAGSVPVICLAVAYADSGLLFILQGIYHETISALIPVAVFSVQSLVGIIWTYMVSRDCDPSQKPERKQ